MGRGAYCREFIRLYRGIDGQRRQHSASSHHRGRHRRLRRRCESAGEPSEGPFPNNRRVLCRHRSSGCRGA
jgi:hypothetical protein